MPAFLAVISKREVRRYTEDPIPDDALQRMLQSGRATGSSRNRQPWRFYVIRNRGVLDELAGLVFEPDNIRGCKLAIALVMTRPSGFDAGRAAQNIGLTAWAEGIGTCPNRPRDLDEVRRLLDLEPDWDVPAILSVGYPAEPVGPRDNDPDGILARIDRKPLEELTHWID
jgi:nitroreductase